MTRRFPVRKLALFSAPFGAAVLLCCTFSAAAAVCAVVCAALFLSFLLLGKRKLPVLILLAGGAAGAAWCLLWSALVLPSAAEFDGRTAEVSALVLSFPQKTSSGVSVDVELENGVTARLFLEEGCAAAPGDTLRVCAEFSRADGGRGATKLYYEARGVLLLAYGDAETLRVIPAEKVGLRFLPARLAERLKESLDGLFPAERAALLRAMLFGDDAALDGKIVSDFRRAGLSHVLVVSGLHLSVILSALRLLTGGNRRVLLLTAFPLTLLFVLLVGCTPSVVRAALMSLIPLAAPLLGREDDPPTTLSFALFLLLLENPFSVTNVSLQLSFAAVAGIMLFSEPLHQWLNDHALIPGYGIAARVGNGVLSFLWVSLSTTAGAMVFTIPLGAVYFSSVSLIAPLSNLLCLWAVSLLVPMGLLCALLGLMLPWAAAAAAVPAGLLCTFLLKTAGILGAPAFAALSMSGVYPKVWLGAVYLIFGAAVLLRRERRRVLLPLCSSLVLLCAALAFTLATHQLAPLTVTVLDVGQGACVALYSKGSTALVDCGGTGAEHPGDTAADQFRQLGTSRLDLLVLTHLDEDHCGGVGRLFALMEVKGVVMPSFDDGSGRMDEILALIREEGAQLLWADSLTCVPFGDAELTLYPPLGGGSTNEAGVFVLCSAGEFDTLITGDADSSMEALFVSRYSIPDVELLVVGHHGAKSSSSDDFLAAVRPEYAVISVGSNHYGHPHADVLARLDGAGANIFRTDRNGSVTAIVHSGALCPE